MIVIIDYDAGNLRSVEKAFNALNIPVKISNKKEDILAADGLVLPGVGAFKDGINNLKEKGLDDAIKQSIKKGTLFLGICLGMQLLLETSEENGLNEGLGIVKGSVKKFDASYGLKIPQMGWNTVEIDKECPLFEGINQNEYFYFVHSYYVQCSNSEDTAGKTVYGNEYTSAIWKDNAFATQFHPEKSGTEGLKILKNFGDMVARKEKSC